jgi:hypothetical protein
MPTQTNKRFWDASSIVYLILFPLFYILGYMTLDVIHHVFGII